MAFSTDNGGFAFSCGDAKLQVGGSTWGTRLSQLGKQSGIVRIVTYSLPRLDYIAQQFERRPKDIFLIAHREFRERAEEVKQRFPMIEVATAPDIHSKVLLIEPSTVMISSANFGSSRWHETTVSFHSREAHDYYVGVFEQLWAKAQTIQLTVTA